MKARRIAPLLSENLLHSRDRFGSSRGRRTVIEINLHESNDAVDQQNLGTLQTDFFHGSSPIRGLNLACG